MVGLRAEQEKNGSVSLVGLRFFFVWRGNAKRVHVIWRSFVHLTVSVAGVGRGVIQVPACTWVERYFPHLSREDFPHSTRAASKIRRHPRWIVDLLDLRTPESATVVGYLYLRKRAQSL